MHRPLRSLAARAIVKQPMRLRWPLLVLPVILAAQTAAPPAYVQGVLLERDPQTASGEFSLRVPGDQVFRFLFNEKTAVDRDQQPIDVSRLQPGEDLEVISDEIDGSWLRFARTIHVLSSPAPPKPALESRQRAYRFSADRMAPLDRLIPATSVGVAGVVFRINRERVVLHTRSGDQTILLRPDTRYIEDGGVVGSSDLKPNMRVYVRTGRTLYNEMEAYQVVWGQILEPR